jgi:hypothetical protein
MAKESHYCLLSTTTLLSVYQLLVGGREITVFVVHKLREILLLVEATVTW